MPNRSPHTDSAPYATQNSRLTAVMISQNTAFSLTAPGSSLAEQTGPVGSNAKYGQHSGNPVELRS